MTSLDQHISPRPHPRQNQTRAIRKRQAQPPQSTSVAEQSLGTRRPRRLRSGLVNDLKRKPSLQTVFKRTHECDSSVHRRRSSRATWQKRADHERLGHHSIRIVGPGAKPARRRLILPPLASFSKKTALQRSHSSVLVAHLVAHCPTDAKNPARLCLCDLRLFRGAEGNRTPDPLHAMEMLYQLSYSPGIGKMKIPASHWPLNAFR